MRSALLWLLALWCWPAVGAQSFDYRVELTPELRLFIGKTAPSAVTHAVVRALVPEDFDPARSYPVMLLSATSNLGYTSSIRLMQAYAEAAAKSGWVLVAADPDGAPEGTDDGLALRFALDTVALTVLRTDWPWIDSAPLAFGGFSAGASYACRLAAAFAAQGRMPVGLFLSGINQPTLPQAAHQFKVNTPAFKRVPVFFAAGEDDDVATPGDHRDVLANFRSAGFRKTRLEFYVGRHSPNASLLPAALKWFLESAQQ